MVKEHELLTRAEERLSQMRIAEALRLFDLAECAHHDPDTCAAGRWTCHMLMGHFERAWRESDSIARRGKPDPNRFWDGQPLAGRHILLRCLHGLGDTLQFVRYAGLIREQARSFTIEAQPVLKSLLEESRIADHVFTWGEPEPFWDQQIEVMELPRIFRTSVDSIPNRIPYIDVSSTPLLRPFDGWRTLRVGVVWASSNYNPRRSVPIECFAALFTIPGISFFSLQAGNERAQLAACSDQVVDLCSESETLLSTAQNLKNLDLIVTVDTMMAHLAGAVGRPVWTLLPFECDWRWMLGREDSPWYPTMRLFRQPRPGDWASVIQRVKTEVSGLACGATEPVAGPQIRGPVPYPVQEA